MRNRMLRRQSLVLSTTLVASLALGCGNDATAPNPGGRLALLRSADGDPLTLLDVETGRVVSRPLSGLGAFTEEAFTASNDGSSVVFTGAGKLIGFDMRS